MGSSKQYKFKDSLVDSATPAFRQYRDLCYGRTSLWYFLKAELIVTLTAGLSGALGLALRRWLYPSLFKSCGRKVIFGKNLTLRHARKISLGDNVVLDDNAVVDAKGETNRGITIGDNVFVGRHTVIYCKNGDLVLERDVNISSNSLLFSCNRLTIGEGTVIASFNEILSGGQYDTSGQARPFSEQSGMITRGPTTVGPNCWLAAQVVIADGVTIGEHCVIGAGSVVMDDIPPNSLAVGRPARPVRSL
ncbi:MAG: acyltransferase [Candidatus Erginobacter occultus]|nr:acyltransferase [Candidatus Erginobacter occultus]